MATQLHNIRRNFIWRIESISPTARFHGVGFESFDPLKYEVGNQSGDVRKFFVRRLGSDGQDLDGTNYSIRKATHNYEVQVFYPDAIGSEAEREDLIAQDRHDILKALRRSGNYVGFDDSNTSTQLRLINRYATGEEVTEDEEEPEVVAMVLTFACLIHEDET